jgi:hypothetical protein
MCAEVFLAKFFHDVLSFKMSSEKTNLTFFKIKTTFAKNDIKKFSSFFAIVP